MRYGQTPLTALAFLPFLGKIEKGRSRRKDEPKGHNIAKPSFTEVVVVVVFFISLASYLTTGV